MIEDLLERVTKDKLKEKTITDKLTGYLVKKKKRGTYQAVQESKVLEQEITEKIIQYVKEWVLNEIIDGFIKKEIDKEIKSQLNLELSSKGYSKVEM